MKPEKLKRIAVLRNDRLGDLVCTLPLMEALRHGCPQSHLTAIVSPGMETLLEHHPHIDQVLLADKKMPTRELTQLLRAGRFDAILLVHCTGRSALAALRAGIPVRVTHARRWFRLLCGTHRFYRSRRNPPLHEADFGLCFAQRLGIPFTLEQCRPQLDVDPVRRAALERRITARLGTDGPLLAVHPGHRLSAYNWPLPNYLETIERLTSVGRVLITGSHYDQESLDWIAERLDPALRGRVMTLTDLSLPQLVAALSLVDSFVASSTGPLHIAAIVSGQAVGLFCDVAYQHPNRWQPVGRQSTILMAHSDAPKPPAIGSPESEAVMAQITVERVVEQMLSGAGRTAAA